MAQLNEHAIEMLKETDLPDLSHLHGLVGNYLAASLAGFVDKHGLEFSRRLATVCRLVDKAKKEYQETRNLIGKDEKEREMSYEEIIKRNEGQYLYLISTIDYLENCLSAVSRIYKLLPELGIAHESDQARAIIDIRNSIEHVDERISRAVEGPLAPIISEGDLAVTVGGDSIKVKDLAEEIERIHQEVSNILSSKL